MKSTLPLLALGAFLGACTEGANLAPQQDALRLDIAAARSVIGVGDTMSVVVTLRNISLRTVSLTFSSSCQILPSVTAQPGGQIVYPGGSWVCLTVMTKLVLGPLGRHRETLLVRGGVASEAGNSAIQLNRGQYLIHAILADGDPPLRAEPFLLTVQ